MLFEHTSWNLKLREKADPSRNNSHHVSQVLRADSDWCSISPLANAFFGIKIQASYKVQKQTLPKSPVESSCIEPPQVPNLHLVYLSPTWQIRHLDITANSTTSRNCQKNTNSQTEYWVGPNPPVGTLFLYRCHLPISPSKNAVT